MTVAEALVESAEPAGPPGAIDAAAQGAGDRSGRNGGRVAQLRQRIWAEKRHKGDAEPSLPRGVFSRLADDPDATDDIRTVDGYVSLPYAAALFDVHRQRLQEAVWRGALPGVKADDGRTSPWMVRVRDVARFLTRNTLVVDRPKGGRPPGGRNLTPGERRYAAATLEIWRQRHAPWMTPEESAQLGERLSEAEGRAEAS